MAKNTEITDKIENARQNLTALTEDLSGNIHKKIELNSCPSPIRIMGIAFICGFSGVLIFKKINKKLVRFTMNFAKTTLLSYISKQSISLIFRKLK